MTVIKRAALKQELETKGAFDPLKIKNYFVSKDFSQYFFLSFSDVYMRMIWEHKITILKIWKEYNLSHVTPIFDIPSRRYLSLSLMFVHLKRNIMLNIMKLSEEELSECMDDEFKISIQDSFRPNLQRQNTVGKLRWNLVRNAIHFIRNAKQNKDEEDKPSLGRLLSRCWPLNSIKFKLFQRIDGWRKKQFTSILIPST